MKRFFYISYATLLTLPAAAFAQSSILTSSDTLKSVVARLLNVMNSLVWPMIGLCIVFFFYGLIKYIRDASSKGHSLGRQQIIWSLIGLFVVFSMWGLVAFISIIFLGKLPEGAQQSNYSNTSPTFRTQGSFQSNGSFQQDGSFTQDGSHQGTSFQPQ